MWVTRNEKKKVEDFMKDAGVSNTDELEKGLPSEIYLEDVYIPTEPKLKKMKEVVPVDIKHSFEPKKIKRLQKNALKEEEAKHRCDRASHL